MTTDLKSTQNLQSVLMSVYDKDWNSPVEVLLIYTEEWRRLHKKELQDLHYAQIIRLTNQEERDGRGTWQVWEKGKGVGAETWWKETIWKT
jgi:hypothetical protein